MCVNKKHKAFIKSMHDASVLTREEVRKEEKGTFNEEVQAFLEAAFNDLFGPEDENK